MIFKLTVGHLAPSLEGLSTVCLISVQAKDQLLSETLENISRHRAEQNKQSNLKYVQYLCQP